MQVILMLAARQGRLPDIIIALLDYGEDPSGCRAGKTLLRNLKSLLVFWQEHYLHKDKDCSTLEKSSLIPFTFWKVFVTLFDNSSQLMNGSQATVDQLVSEDATQATAILHYVQVLTKHS